MPDFPTLAQTVVIAKRTLSTSGSRLDPGAVDRQGNVLNIMTALAHELKNEAFVRAYNKIAALTIDGSFGSDLDAVGYERTFGTILRVGASPAVVPLVLLRPTAAAGAGTLFQGSTFTLNGTLFTLDTDVPFAATQTGPIVTTATASTAGSLSSIPALTSGAWAPASGVFDPTVTIYTTDISAGAADAQDDRGYKSALRNFPQAVQKGTLAALVFCALSVPGIKQATAVDGGDLSTGPYSAPVMYLADANGQCNNALLQNVRNALVSYRCGGIIPRLVSSVPSFVSFVLKIGYLSGYATATVQAQARAVVVAAVNSIPPYSNLDRSLVLAALRTVPGIVVGDTAIQSPVGSLVATTGTIFRTRADLVSFS